MRSSDSHTEDIVVDHARIARDYALMRLEYLKYSNGDNLDRSLEQIQEDFEEAQANLLRAADSKSRKEEVKVTEVFNHLLKETRNILGIGRQSKKINPMDVESVSSPAARLRRRVSIEESENVSSPATPSKKKGSRLAAKPLLDNIDENAPVNSPKPTRRKSVAARDDPVEDKPLTPARRSVRIRSNTSITAETPQGFESPRAKRASRRNSFAGSDNESAVTTPVKQTRRTRKDSTSSIELIGDTAPSAPLAKQLQGDVIPEEPELIQNKSNGSISNEENNSPNNSVRKSARLRSKTKTVYNKDHTLDTSVGAASKKTRNSTAEKGSTDEDGKSSKKPDKINKESKAKGTKANQQDNTKRNLFASSDGDLNKSDHKGNTTSDKKPNSQVDSGNEDTSQKATNETSEITVVIIQTDCDEDVTDADKDTDAAKETDAIADMLNEKDATPLKCTVFIDDSSSNTGSLDIDDQCVPVLNHEIKANSNIISKDNSLMSSANLGIFQEKPHSLSISTVVTCEPMDIDETITEHDSYIDVCKETETATVANVSVSSVSENKREESLSQSKQSNIVELTPIKSKTSEENSKTVKESDNAGMRTPDENKNAKSNRKSSLSKTNTSVNSATENLETEAKANESPVVDAVRVMKNEKVKNKKKSSASMSLEKSVDNSVEVNTNELTTEVEIPQSNTDLNVSETKKRKSKNKSLSQTNTSHSSEKSIVETDMANNSTTKLDSSQLKLPEAEKSKRKSRNKSLSQSQELEKSSNENKSTLILSQIKDTSCSAKSPKENIQNDSNHADNEEKKQSSKLKNISNIQSSENTPLKEKSLSKLGMQTSTPVVPDKITMNQKMHKLIVEKSNKSNISVGRKDKSQDSTEESDDNSESEQNELIDNEAQDAGDDYESGDSQNEEERLCIEENEIIERGETLDSDGDESNDTDYEKDSFVVSSDEEDNELLDGSGDDLNLSDNELTMSAKSKKKYNERKSKEQKKASREMYESRHKNKSIYDSSSSEEEGFKPIKKNRRRLDSSVLDSENENVQTKGNRMRLNSTLDEITINKGNVSQKKKPPIDSSEDENEISAVCNKSILDKKDPLRVDVKLEPKTPQKSLDISTVNISAHLPMHEVRVNEDISMVANNETSDPLQEAGDDSLSSENQEVMENYDSMLNSLNKSHQKKDLKNKKDKNEVNKSKAKNDEDSSDLIDLKLLFPDNDSESEADETEQFISLKKTPAKTDIRAETEEFSNDDSDEEINSEVQPATEVDDIDGTSNLQQNQNEPVTEHDTYSDKLDQSKQNKEQENLNMSVTKDADCPSSQKKKRKDKKLSESIHEDLTDNVVRSPNTSTKSKKNKNKLSTSHTETDTGVEQNSVLNVQVPSDTEIIELYNSSMSKKQKGERLSQSFNEHSIEVLEEVKKAKKSKKQKEIVDKNDDTVGQADVTISMDVNEGVIEQCEEVTTNDTSLLKKKKKKLSLTASFETKDTGKKSEDVDSEVLQSTSVLASEDGELNERSSKKKNKKLKKSIITNSLQNQTPEIEPVADSAVNKTHQNDSICAEDAVDPKTTPDVKTAVNANTEEISNKSRKRKRRSSGTTSAEVESEGTSVEQSESHLDGRSQKKKIKIVCEENTLNQDEIVVQEEQQNLSDSSTKKKKKKNIAESNEGIVEDENAAPEEQINVSDSSAHKKNKKNKKKDPELEDVEDVNAALEEQQNASDSSAKKKNKKSKKKLVETEVGNVEDENVAPEEQQNVSDSSTQKKIKKNKKKIAESDGDIVEDTTKQNIKSKKRKHREDDQEKSTAKVFKENLDDNVNVARLPDTILENLEGKPKRTTNSKPPIVATSNFVVEEGKRRKNKPSQYLEQSVYLDSDSPDKRKVAEKIKKPKVLPFVPTASTSSYGFTSNFKVNVIPKETKFIAQSNNIPNFKNDYLNGKNIKRMGTYELYKKQRTLKLSKF